MNRVNPFLPLTPSKPGLREKSGGRVEKQIPSSNNRRWAAERIESEPGFFEGLINQRSPKSLCIGCAGSKVPSNQIAGLDPGEVFVHRNIANAAITLGEPRSAERPC